MSSGPIELTLDVHPNVTFVRGLDEQIAAKLFGHRTRRFRGGGRSGLRYSEQVSTDYLRDEMFGQRTIIPTCRLDEYTHTLRREGFVLRHNSSSCISAFPNLDWTTDQSAWVQDCARSLSVNPVGRILIDGDKQRIDVLLLICQLFADTNVVVVVPNLKEVERLTKIVSERHPGRTTTYSANVTGATRCVLVCCEATYVGLDPGYFHVVIFTDLLKSLSKKLLLDTISLGDHYIYAIEDSRKALDHDQNWKAEYLAGHQVYSCVQHRRCPAHAWLVGAQQSDGSSAGDTLEQKKTWIWENAGRNRLITELAGLLTHGQCPDCVALPEELQGRPLRVAILVESPAHGRVLQDLLPDWCLLSRDDSVAGDQSAAVPDRTIVTRLWANSQASIDVGVLIRAEGDASPLNLRSFPPKASANGNAPVLLVDFYDLADSNSLPSRRQHFRGDGYLTIMNS